MSILALDSILLFILVIPFIMGYRISPFQTQYWLFGIIFLGLFINLLLDLFRNTAEIYQTAKNLILWILIILIIGSSFSSAIHFRHKTHPVYQIHDIILQQEAAIQYLIHGKNPYSEQYFGTFLEQWHYSDKEVNPALYHFVMEPFYLLFSLPFYSLSNHTIGYFDGRIPLLFLFTILLIAGFRLIKEQEKRRIFVILLAFHPAVLPYTLEGRSDIFMYAFLFLGWYLLYKKRLAFAGILFAFAFATKQSAWLLFPFYTAYLYFTSGSIRKTVFNLLPFTIIVSSIILPFYAWDSKGYLDSTIGFLNGTVDHSYPISGYGLGGILVEKGIVQNKFIYYPFYIWQAIFGIPALLLLLYFVKKQKSIQSVILSYGLFLFIYWYFSRYFNNSHLAYISLVFLTAYFWPHDENKEIHREKEQRKIDSKSERRRFVRK